MTVHNIGYSVKFPVTQVLFDDEDVTFSIERIKSRLPSIFYFILHGYGLKYTPENPHEILVDGNPLYTSPRALVGTDYQRYIHEFSINKDVLEEVAFTQIELRLLGITSENPLYFNGAMLQDEPYDTYHSPEEEIISTSVNFQNNSYANLYQKNGDYLQVIRPTKTKFLTDKLLACECTVLAPHFEDDIGFDDDIAVFMEFLNQTNQKTGVLR